MNLNEAVEKYRKHRRSPHMGELYPICDAYLDEHPEDDDELFTSEWLSTQNEFEVREWDDRFSIPLKPSFYLCIGRVPGWNRIEFHNRETNQVAIMPEIETRGQLRQLVKALKGE